MTMPCYKHADFNDNSGLLQEWQSDNDKFDNNNENKVYLLLKK